MEKTIHILLVEDNPDDATIILEMLEETNSIYCHVHWVDLLAKGRQWLDQHPQGVDLILLDLSLPDSRGIDTVLNIRKHTPSIPLIVLTGLDDESIGKQAIKEGAQDYIFKNDLNLNILEHSLCFAIERHQLKTQLENKRNQVQESESLFRHIIEKNVDGILILDQQGKILFSNPKADAIFALKPDEIPNQLFHQAQLTDETIELTFLSASGELRFLEMETRAIPWEGKAAILASLRDITDRKLLEKSLLIEKERLDITLRSIGDGIITTDKNGNIRLINQAAEEMTGLNQARIAGQPVTQYLNLEIPLLSTQEQGQGISYGTSSFTRKGTEKTIEYTQSPILDQNDQLIGYGFTIRDTTLQKKMAEETTKVQKLESLGIVAGKLAHDFDNVFTVILGNLSIAKSQLKNNSKVFHMLEKSEISSLRAKELTNQLHTFARVGASYQRTVSISKLLKNIVKIIMKDNSINNSSISTHWHVSNKLWEVEFDKAKMNRAIYNIIRNAVEAMSGNGLLDITLQNQMISEKMHLPLKSGSYLKISIKDNGVGIQKEIQHKIFDPFFTTKKKATGMGLTTAFSIIRDHQGTLEVETNIGKGSTFSIYLPSIVTHGDKEEESGKENRK